MGGGRRRQTEGGDAGAGSAVGHTARFSASPAAAPGAVLVPITDAASRADRCQITLPVGACARGRLGARHTPPPAAVERHMPQRAAPSSGNVASRL